MISWGSLSPSYPHPDDKSRTRIRGMAPSPAGKARLRSVKENVPSSFRFRSGEAASSVESTGCDMADKTRVMFVQGGGEGAHDSWDNKLVASLEQALGAGYSVRYPRMPKE